MDNQSDNKQMQMMMEHNGKGGMEMSMSGCHTTMYAFGILVILGLAIEVILQAKMLKALRKK